MTCIAVYMLVMSFSQKGIDELSRYQQHCVMRNPDEDFEASEGFDEGMCRISSFGLLSELCSKLMDVCLLQL